MLSYGVESTGHVNVEGDLSLAKLWKSNPEIRSKSLKQIVVLAGNDGLKDRSEASYELRNLLTSPNLDSGELGRYAAECIGKVDKNFPDAPRALQDVMNAVGQRLGFEVEFGNYQGSVSAPAPDGIWIRRDESHVQCIAMECKTSGNVHQIDLERLAKHREHVAKQRNLSADMVTTLIVVGAEKTDALEAQIRGSAENLRAARVVGIESLVKLMLLWAAQENSVNRDRLFRILQPAFHTRLDEIVELVFATAEEQDPLPGPPWEGEEPPSGPTPVANFHSDCIKIVAANLQIEFLPESKTRFVSIDGRIRLVLAVSRTYENPRRYWFAFHDYYRDFLAAAAEDSFVAFGCGSAEQTLLIPWQQFRDMLPMLNNTKGKRLFWHVIIDGDRLNLRVKGGGEPISLVAYLL